MSRSTDEYSPGKDAKFYGEIYERVYKHLFPKIRELIDEFTKIILT